MKCEQPVKGEHKSTIVFVFSLKTWVIFQKESKITWQIYLANCHLTDNLVSSNSDDNIVNYHRRNHFNSYCLVDSYLGTRTLENYYQTRHLEHYTQKIIFPINQSRALSLITFS